MCVYTYKHIYLIGLFMLLFFFFFISHCTSTITDEQQHYTVTTTIHKFLSVDSYIRMYGLPLQQLHMN